ncbi:hypothetical protein NUW54_g9430 [Trametes sanguinea]|uniref:Uncharacterized protein n=1 Tax=Trametes sanguinea TaxID=158606 RepID=A0ACC1P7C1_9APHY|nr:hypothetical protein NUW54_g9430 [Trametes sanguinea]
MVLGYYVIAFPAGAPALRGTPVGTTSDDSVATPIHHGWPARSPPGRDPRLALLSDFLTLSAAIRVCKLSDDTFQEHPNFPNGRISCPRREDQFTRMETRTKSVRALPVENYFSFRTKYRKALAIQQHPNRGVSVLHGRISALFMLSNPRSWKSPQATYLCGRCIQRRRRRGSGRGSDDADGNLYDNACLERSKRRIRDFPCPMLAQRPGIIRALDLRISLKFQVGLAVINVTFHTAPVPWEATNSGQVAQQIDPPMTGGVGFNGSRCETVSVLALPELTIPVSETIGSVLARAERLADMHLLPGIFATANKTTLLLGLVPSNEGEVGRLEQHLVHIARLISDLSVVYE